MTAIGLFSALVPFLVVPVAFLFGARRALLVAAALCGVFILAPYVWFAARAVMEDVPIWPTVSQVSSLVLTAQLAIAGWMLMWSAIYVGGAYLLTLAWQVWREKQAA